MPHRYPFVAILAALTGTLSLPVTPARAGTETVYTCRNADGSPGTDVDWTMKASEDSSSLGTLAWSHACSGGGPLTSRLDGPSFAAGEGLGWRFNVQLPLRIVDLRSLDRETVGLGRSAGYGDRIWYIGGKDDGSYLDQCLPAYADDVGESCSPTFNIARSTRVSFSSFGGPDSGWTAALGCVGNAPNSYCQTPSSVAPSVRVYAATFRVSDASDPAINRVTGPLADDAVVRGGAELTLSAADTGSGVYQAVLKAGGRVVETQGIDANSGACVDNKPGNDDPYEFGQAAPCRSSVSKTLSFDTTRLPEGPVPVQVVVRDATGNEAIAVNRTVVVDNIPAPRLLGAPELSGTPAVGHSLVVEPGRWDASGRNLRFSYRWLRCNGEGADCQLVGGRSGPGYDLEQVDVGRRLVAEVTASSDQGDTVARSAPSAPIGGGSDGRGALNGENASDQARLTASFVGTRRTSVTGRYGRRYGVVGTLRSADGTPIRGALIEVATRAASPGAALIQRSRVTTTNTGSWALRAAPGRSSRVLRFRYRTRLSDAGVAAEVALKVRVRAAIGLRITPRHTSNHGTIRLSGRLRGGPVPGRGKVIELQARGKGGGRWLTFRTLRTDRRGVFATRYRFHATYGPVTYVFRVRARAESAYPYLTGVSKLVGVRVG